MCEVISLTWVLWIPGDSETSQSSPWNIMFCFILSYWQARTWCLSNIHCEHVLYRLHAVTWYCKLLRPGEPARIIPHDAFEQGRHSCSSPHVTKRRVSSLEQGSCCAEPVSCGLSQEHPREWFCYLKRVLSKEQQGISMFYVCNDKLRDQRLSLRTYWVSKWSWVLRWMYLRDLNRKYFLYILQPFFKVLILTCICHCWPV